MRFLQNLREQFALNCRLGLLAIRLTWQASSRLATSILLLALLSAALSPLELLLFKLVVDTVASDLGLAVTPNPLTGRLPLAAWVLLAAGVLAARQLIQPFLTTFNTVAGDRLTGHVTGRLIRATNAWRGLARFEDPGYADDLYNARTHASRAGLNIMTYGANAVTSLLASVGVGLVLLGLSAAAPVLIVLATLPQMTKWWSYGTYTVSHLYNQTPEARRLQYSRDIVLTPQPAKDVRLYGLGPFFRQRYDHSFDRVLDELDRQGRKLSARIGLYSSLSGLAVGLVYAFTVWQAVRGVYSIGDVVLYSGAATALRGNLVQLSIDLSFVPTSFGFLPSLFRVLDETPDLEQSQHPKPVPQPFRDGIVFDDVHFTYSERTSPVLNGVTFRLSPGESLALVGLNGSGKTTIVKLLLRLYDPTRGRILLDGVDLRDYNLDELRTHVGVIFQDFVRYELTARENIALGSHERREDSRLLDAARKAKALDLVQSLPDQLDTQLGREFGGRELSGGEWQKLALSRAFVRDNQLLVLDEPTAALDVQTEFEVYQSFHELTRGKTTLLISHRLSTIRMADRIIYLENGRIQEEGTHEDLMEQRGRYAELYSRQAAQYIDTPAGDEAYP